MRLGAILLSRTIAFVESAELAPRAGLFYPEFSKALVERYNFQKYPRTFEEWHGTDGAEFQVGKIGTQVIQKLVIWNNGFTVETRSGTEQAQNILLKLLAWAKDRFGLTHGPETKAEWAYVSDLTFYTDVPILSTRPIDRLAERVSKEISAFVTLPLPYSPAHIAVAHDPTIVNHGRANFSIQRRAETPFDKNMYFSEAPLPTEVHLKLLEEFERDVAAGLETR